MIRTLWIGAFSASVLGGCASQKLPPLPNQAEGVVIGRVVSANLFTYVDPSSLPPKGFQVTDVMFVEGAKFVVEPLASPQTPITLLSEFGTSPDSCPPERPSDQIYVLFTRPATDGSVHWIVACAPIDAERSHNIVPRPAKPSPTPPPAASAPRP